MSHDYDRNHFSLLARYNRAANEKLFAHLAALPAEVFTADRGSYFGSIRGILGHLMTCDINWMRRFRELFGDAGPLAHPRLSPEGHAWTTFEFDTLTLPEFESQRRLVDTLLSEFVRTADTSRFGDALVYADSHGTKRRYVFRETLDHVFNHQTHHRGQVSQLLDELGVENDFSNILDILEAP
jgi:uncharacterized damage-inducible protein DinB